MDFVEIVPVGLCTCVFVKHNIIYKLLKDYLNWGLHGATAEGLSSFCIFHQNCKGIYVLFKSKEVIGLLVLFDVLMFSMVPYLFILFHFKWLLHSNLDFDKVLWISFKDKIKAEMSPLKRHDLKFAVNSRKNGSCNGKLNVLTIV